MGLSEYHTSSGTTTFVVRTLVRDENELPRRALQQMDDRSTYGIPDGPYYHDSNAEDNLEVDAVGISFNCRVSPPSFHSI